MRQCLVIAAAIVLTGLMATTAAGHPGHGEHFSDGWRHPFLGLDHLLAMIAVGLLAIRMRGKAVWAIPAVFVGSMVVGGFLATTSLTTNVLANAAPSGPVEYGIALSVLVLGILIAMKGVVSLRVGAAVVVFFALFHGFAHVAEMPRGAFFASYAGGFVLASALLHVAGVLGGAWLVGAARSKPIRITGAAISALGLCLLLGMI